MEKFYTKRNFKSVMESPNWFELKVKIPQKYETWIKTNNLSDQVLEVPKPHITVLYGFDPSRFSEVKKIVDDFSFVPEDFTFGEVKKGDVANVYLVKIFSPKLQECFWHLYRKFPNEHTLINGFYDPHVTLAIMK